MKHVVLVTGGAGFIGSHTCKALYQSGYLPVVLDSLVTGYESFVKWGPLIKADISDAHAVKNLIAQYKPVATVHFAAFINVGESVTNPEKYYANNVVKSLQFFEILRQCELNKIVFSSTAAVYGNPALNPILETAVLNPINPYGVGKYCIERILQDFDKAYDFRFAALRYFNAAGSDPDQEVGEAHVPETHLIPLVLDAVLGKRPFVTVYGQNYPTSDGTCVRDYIHVADLASAHVKALEHLLQGNPSFQANLGTGKGYSVLEVIDAVQRVTQKKVPMQTGPRREGDPSHLVADSTFVQNLLGWTPRLSDLDTLVAHAWQWRKQERGVR